MYIGIVTIYVNDQDRAKEFYTKKLGWKVQDDVPMGEGGGRWLSVAPHGGQTAAVLAKDFGDWSPEKVGRQTGIILEVEDLFDSCDEFTRRGVEFETQPSIESFGGWATVKDSEGNILGVHSPVPVGAREMMP
jgi:lactoylglutathione lyase